MDGFIKIHRKMIYWEWYNEPNTFRLFIHLLIKASYIDKKWKGIEIKRGQLFTSINHLSSELCLSNKAIRISIDKLIRSNNVAIKGASNGTMITICNYDDYQDNQKLRGEQNGKPEGNQGATSKESIESKEEKNKNNTIDFPKSPKPPKKTYHEDVEFLYGLYPTTCPIKKSLTGKCSKNKDTLVVLLKTKKKEELEKSINYYLDDCKKANRYLKNFTTFLANIPEYEEQTLEKLDYAGFEREYKALIAHPLPQEELSAKNKLLREKYKVALEEFNSKNKR